MERYNTQGAINAATNVISEVKKEELKNTRRAFNEIYASRSFADYAREVELFLVLQKVSTKTIAKDLGKLTDVLRRFSTHQAYADLARLIFEEIAGIKIESTVDGVVDIELDLNPVKDDWVTVGGDNVTTLTGDQIQFLRIGTSQQQNDYRFLCNFLAPPQIIVNVTYT